MAIALSLDLNRLGDERSIISSFWHLLRISTIGQIHLDRIGFMDFPNEFHCLLCQELELRVSDKAFGFGKSSCFDYLWNVYSAYIVFFSHRQC